MKYTHNYKVIARITAVCLLALMILAGFGCRTNAVPESMEVNLLGENMAPIQRATHPFTLVEKYNPYSFRNWYDIGINRELEGTPYVVVFFLDDDVSSWTEDGVGRFYNKLVAPSLDFLEESAEYWGVSLDFQVGYDATYLHPQQPLRYEGIVEPNNDTSASRDIADQVARSRGYASKEEMHAALQAQTGEQEIIYLFMLNKSGQTHARIYYNCAQNAQFENESLFEYCVIYTGFEPGVENVGNEAVAHEILHLYGAQDYYTPEERYTIASVICPTDIMLCMQNDVSNYDVTQLTAYSVGWYDLIPEEFLVGA